MDAIAMWIGYAVIVPSAALCAIAPVWLLLGYAGRNSYKRLTRVYSLNVVWYWLNRLEEEGKRCFEKAYEEDTEATK